MRLSHVSRTLLIPKLAASHKHGVTINGQSRALSHWPLALGVASGWNVAGWPCGVPRQGLTVEIIHQVTHKIVQEPADEHQQQEADEQPQLQQRHSFGKLNFDLRALQNTQKPVSVHRSDHRQAGEQRPRHDGARRDESPRRDRRLANAGDPDKTEHQQDEVENLPDADADAEPEVAALRPRLHVHDLGEKHNEERKRGKLQVLRRPEHNPGQPQWPRVTAEEPPERTTGQMENTHG